VDRLDAGDRSRSDSHEARAAKPSALVTLVGFQDQGNLGMGYLAAVLLERGFRVEMLDVREDAEKLAAAIAASKPVIVGFSLIFQVFLPQFRALAQRLRAFGVSSHFTIGGHFASLCHEELLANFPEIDSVARFEGEQTLLELVERLQAGRDWRDIEGIAFLKGGEVVATPLREHLEDLDTLPFPYRPYGPEHIGGFPTLPVLASRGCVRRCSFCSIHTFYRGTPGRVVRVRKPEKVVEEMLQLYRRQSVRVFLFQDDDFPLWGKKGRRWADELVSRLHDSGLAEKTIWKISCRAEYVEPELFQMLRDAGLFLVYMGLESGVDQGLDILFKQTSVEQNLAAVDALKTLDLGFSYGFMLFDPTTTFESIRDNIGFLRKIVGDGSAPAVFSRMLPYGGTPIRAQLAKEGRLRGDLTRPEYDFLDLRLNDYHRLLTKAVRPFIHKYGLAYSVGYALDEFETITRLTPFVTGAQAYRVALRRLAAEVNLFLFTLVEQSSLAFEAGDGEPFDYEGVRAYCEDAQSRLIELRNEFVAENLDPLAQVINADCASGPVLTPQIH
jgi:radical SAM superfamily enzyme YgiQ (UPF0313 family)